MIVRTYLQKIRKSRNISAAELADRVGVRRQTIYAIEDGNFVPNTTISLQLARALGVSVEELFSMTQEQAEEPRKARVLGGGREINEGQLVRICRVKERLVAFPISLLSAYLPPADGIIESKKKLSVMIRSPVGLPESDKRLLLAGCDPALSLLHDALHSSGIEIITIPSSSRRALQWLKQASVHAAGSHLLDRTTGDYNVPIIRRLLPNAPPRVVTFAIWEQGLVLRHSNPKRIRTIADLADSGITLINREKGSGSRDLLDTGLRKFGIRPGQVRGYKTIASGHLAAAQAVAAGTADCCIAPRSAARCFGLDFVPLAVERFDLSFTKASLELPSAKALLDLLNRSNLRKNLQYIAGYDTAHTGEVLM